MPLTICRATIWIVDAMSMSIEPDGDDDESSLSSSSGSTAGVTAGAARRAGAATAVFAPPLAPPLLGLLALAAVFALPGCFFLAGSGEQPLPSSSLPERRSSLKSAEVLRLGAMMDAEGSCWLAFAPDNFHAREKFKEKTTVNVPKDIFLHYGFWFLPVGG